MAYIGHSPSTGEDNNFKILDDISSYTLTFDGSSSSVVSAANDTIYAYDHRFIQGQRVTYNNGGGGNINGLSSGSVYFVIKQDHNNIKLATTAARATSGTAIDISLSGTSGTSHTLNVAFDGVNTKFKATHTTGKKARITRGAQLVLSVNGVIQQPHDSSTPSTGFGFDLDSTIVFSQAPQSTDAFWGHILTNNNVTFDISDNRVDHFSGDGSTSSFTLSKSPPNNENILVTIDGVVQYPNDSAGNIRAYSVAANVINFTTAPGSGTQIEVRHIGFAGATSGGGGGVTGVYGRTGNVVLLNTDNITVNDAAITGDATVTGDATITGDLTVNGTTTTIDTTLKAVDRIEVADSSTNVAVAVTQSSTGSILKLFDGSSEVFSVDDGNKVGIADSIYHIGDTDTNIRFPADDTFTVHTASIERFRINSGGQVSIGTTIEGHANADELTVYNQSNAGITIRSGASDAGRIYFSDATSGTGEYQGKFEYHHTDNTFRISNAPNGSGGVEKVCIDSAGKVGIGSMVPVSILDIVAADPVLTIRDTDTGLATANATLRLGESTTGPILDNYWDVVADNTAGNFGFAIKQKISGSTNTRFVIAPSTGRVGIGLTNPDHNLHVYQNAGDAVVTIESQGNGNDAALEFIRTSSGGDSKGAGSIYVTGNTGASEAKMQFGVGHNISHGTLPRMTIMGNGEVGIGTDNPAYFIHVESGTPYIRVKDTAAPADERTWDFNAGTDGILRFRNTNDAANSSNNWLEVERNGVATDSIRLLTGSGTERLRITSTGEVKIMNPGGTVGLYLQSSSGAVSNFRAIGTNNQSLGYFFGNDERVRFASNGNVGIGVTNPGGKLDVDGNIAVSTGNRLYFGNSDVSWVRGEHGGSGYLQFGVNTEHMRLLRDGNLGIGTDNPTRKLHVFGDGDTKSIVAAVAGDALFDLSNTGNGNYSGINFTRERSTGSVVGGSIFMPSVTANNSALLYLQTQTASAQAGVDSALVDNNGVRVKLASQPGGVAANSAFSVEVGASERMRINSSGFVGINTDSSLKAPLHVGGGGLGAAAFTSSPYNKVAVFGAKGWVSDTRYHYTDATIFISGRNNAGIDTGAGIEFNTRTEANNNWRHGAITFGRDGNFRVLNGGAGVTEGTEKLKIQTNGNIDFYANQAHLYNNVDTSNTYFYAQNTGAGNAGVKMKNNQGEWTIIANDRLRFIDDDAGEERLSLASDGKIWLEGNEKKHPLPQYVSMFACDANTWVKFATVVGNQFSSDIMMTMHDTTSSVVFTANYHIKCGHYQDIWIESRELAYSSMGVKIISNDNQNFDIYGKRNGGASQSTSSNVEVHIIPLNGETVTFNSTVNYSGQELIHTTSTGTLKITCAGGVQGNISIPGNLSKGSGSFTIPHPLPSKKETYDLNHSFVEGPQCDLIYRGKTNLVAGISTVNIDTKAGMTEGTFVLLNRDIQCFTSNETGWGAVKGSVTGNILTITAQDNSSTDTISWMVVGERQDDTIKKSVITDNDGNLLVETLRDAPPDTSHLAEYYPT